MKKVSMFPAGIQNVISTGTIAIQDVCSLIKYDATLRQKTVHLRNILESKDLQDSYKRSALEYVTFGGIYSERRDDKQVELSGFVCLDLDNLEEPQLLKRNIIEESNLPVLIFVSPRGNGLKIVFRTNPDFSYKENYAAYSKYVSSEFNVPISLIDKSCSSPSKACFLCHDSEVYLNPLLNKNEVSYLSADFFHKESFAIDEEKTNSIGFSSIVSLIESPGFQYSIIKLDFNKPNSVENFIALCRNCIRKQGKFVDGQRHNWVLQLANLCNAFGMDREKAIAHFKQCFKEHPAIVQASHPFDWVNDLEKPFMYVYDRSKDQFGTWMNNADEYETPFLPDDIFDRLPKFIRKHVTLFEKKRERDVSCLGMITLLSSCFPMVQGVYRRSRVRANLYLFVCAPPGSGKGILADIRMIGNGIHEALWDRYKDELQVYDSLPEEEKKKAQKPKLIKFFIPANNTSARLIQSISVNRFLGILMDTEADTLTNANKAEHGHFSEILRKVFHHESIEYERKLNDEYLCINNPAFSIIMSGTPNQIQRMVSDIENGLTSRFMYYKFVSTCGWDDVFAKGQDLSHVFKSASVDLYNLSNHFLFTFLENTDSEILFDLTDSQKKSLNEWFSEKTESLESLYGPDIKASVYRLGLIVFRIAMILSIVRKVEDLGNSSVVQIKSIVCGDRDFETAMAIISTLLHHTVDVYNLLKKGGHVKKFRNQKQIYVNKLPDEFDFQMAMEIAELLGINKKTAENYLSQAVHSEHLVKVKHNHYKKPESDT